MKAAIIAEHDNQVLKPVTRHIVTAATKLANELILIVIGKNCQTVVDEASKLAMVTKVVYVDHEAYEHQLAENSAALLQTIAETFQYILAPATTFGKNLLPRLAALLNTSMVSDVIDVLAEDTFLRPMYAGNILAKVQTDAKIKLLTIRATHFKAIENKEDKAVVEKLDTVIDTNVQFENRQLTKSARPELTEARVVVSGGRGLKSAENFKLLEKIADHLGAAIGASRAAVDAGFAPNDYQVGQTGKVVAPDLYIAIGISGAIQHIAGMKDSKVIVAINNDPEAAIFEVADYKLVGDLFKILPELEKALE